MNVLVEGEQSIPILHRVNEYNTPPPSIAERRRDITLPILAFLALTFGATAFLTEDANLLIRDKILDGVQEGLTAVHKIPHDLHPLLSKISSTN